MRIRARLAMLLALAAGAATVQAAGDYSGFHAGLAVGPRGVSADWQTTATRFPDSDPAPASSDPTAKYKDSAIGLAGFAGYDWTLGSRWLVGAEAAIGTFSAKDRTDDRIPGLGDTEETPTSFAEVKSGQSLALRARGGFLFGPGMLVYGRIGVESIKAKAIATCPADTNVCDPSAGTQQFRNSKRMTGLGLGVGVEKVFDSGLSLRAEVRHADHGKFSFTAIPESNTTFGADAEVEVTSSVLEIGLAYRF